MQSVPSPAQVKELIAPLDALDRKILGGLVALMMTEPERIRDQEWMSEKFVHVSVIAHGFADDGPASTEDVARIQAYAQSRMPDIVLCAANLFVRVAEDLRERTEKPDFETARAVVRAYLESD
jgi:hypothetical protein